MPDSREGPRHTRKAAIAPHLIEVDRGPLTHAAESIRTIRDEATDLSHGCHLHTFLEAS
jgi:hypothetical protein